MKTLRIVQTDPINWDRRKMVSISPNSLPCERLVVTLCRRGRRPEWTVRAPRHACAVVGQRRATSSSACRRVPSCRRVLTWPLSIGPAVGTVKTAQTDRTLSVYALTQDRHIQWNFTFWNSKTKNALAYSFSNIFAKVTKIGWCALKL